MRRGSKEFVDGEEWSDFSASTFDTVIGGLWRSAILI
ncbi:hypothetical protein GGE07_004024 [Sinorhizobium terangae]|nr:hypothetical protein [Sinorhizobium terangae]